VYGIGGGGDARSAATCAAAPYAAAAARASLVTPAPPFAEGDPSHACGMPLRGRGGCSATLLADEAVAAVTLGPRSGFGACDECTLGGAPSDQAAADQGEAAWVVLCFGVPAGNGAARLLDRRGDVRDTGKGAGAIAGDGGGSSLGDIEMLAVTGGGRATLLLRISASRSCVSGPSPASTTFGKSRCVESDAARDGGIASIEVAMVATAGRQQKRYTKCTKFWEIGSAT